MKCPKHKKEMTKYGALTINDEKRMYCFCKQCEKETWEKSIEKKLIKEITERGSV
jgi:hypothetical protein